MSKRTASNLRNDAANAASEEAPPEDVSPKERVGVKILRAEATEHRVQAEAAQKLSDQSDLERHNKKRRKSIQVANPDPSNDENSSISDADSKSDHEEGEVRESIPKSKTPSSTRKSEIVTRGLRRWIQLQNQTIIRQIQLLNPISHPNKGLS